MWNTVCLLSRKHNFSTAEAKTKVAVLARKSINYQASPDVNIKET
jgi:hypothetical protein